jgi:hypothetical protein
MGLKKTLGKLAKAAPVILAYAPAVIDAARQVKKAVKKPRPAPETPPA